MSTICYGPNTSVTADITVDLFLEDHIEKAKVLVQSLCRFRSEFSAHCGAYFKRVFLEMAFCCLLGAAIGCLGAVSLLENAVC